MNCEKHPVRRWSVVTVTQQTGGGPVPGIASGQTLEGFKVPIPRTGYITSIAARVYDPSSNTNETINLTASETIEVKMRVNNESPTNFQWLGISTFAGVYGKPRSDVLLWVEKNDDVELDFRNTRLAGNDLYVIVEFGFSDPDDVEKKADLCAVLAQLAAKLGAK